MKVTNAQLWRATDQVARNPALRSASQGERLTALINAVLADPEVRAQFYREEAGGGRSSLFGGSRG